MNIVNKLFSIEEFRKYVEDKKFGLFSPNKIVLHHTAVPDLSTWHGQESILALKKCYEAKGWTSGPHLFVAPEGIWVFTDIDKQGTHAGSGNTRSIGIETVGNYDNCLPSGEVWRNAKFAIMILMNKLKLTPDKNLYFHREFSNTHCPGLKITKPWVIQELSKVAVISDKSVIKPDTSNSIYYYKNNIAYPIPDWETFMFFWKPEDIIKITEDNLSNLKEGKTLPSVKTSL